MRCPAIMIPLLRRWRSLGHGIHSPFAFAFVTTVLRQPCDYYAYSAIDPLAADKADRDTARRLFRIIIALRPVSVNASGEISPACRMAIDLAMKSFSAPASSEMWVSAPQTSCPLRAEQTAVVIGRGKALSRASEAIFAPLTRSMLFAGCTMAVVVGQERLPKQKFTVDI